MSWNLYRSSYILGCCVCGGLICILGLIKFFILYIVAKITSVAVFIVLFCRYSFYRLVWFRSYPLKLGDRSKSTKREAF